MPIKYDPPAALAVRTLMEDQGRRLLVERAIVALRGLSTDPGDARLRRRPYAPYVDWGFVVRTRDEELLILWDWDADHEVVRVRYVGPDLLGR